MTGTRENADSPIPIDEHDFYIMYRGKTMEKVARIEHGRWWVGPAITLVIAIVSVAAAYGAMAYQVSEIRQYGSIPVHDLDKRVSVLENNMRIFIEQNKADHTLIIQSLEKIERKLP